MIVKLLGCCNWAETRRSSGLLGHFLMNGPSVRPNEWSAQMKYATCRVLSDVARYACWIPESKPVAANLICKCGCRCYTPTLSQNHINSAFYTRSGFLF